MLRSLTKTLATYKPQNLHKIPKSHFIRIKKKTTSKIKEQTALRGEAVVDDKFIKLTVRDESTSKLKQLAKLREENLKIIHTHDHALETKIDDVVRKDFEKLKMTTKIDMLDEPLMLFSLLKESQLRTLSQREDPSVKQKFDRNILKLMGMTPKEMKEYLKHVNIERQINESFDVKVYFLLQL
jgi:hypothetical protein